MSSLVVVDHRYDRQERITWWDQSLLAASRVVVVGAGALGNEIVKNLVLVGVGTIDIVDFDTIELSNLARCVFFREADEGQPKAPVLARRARELNPDVQVNGHLADARELGAGVFRRAAAVVGALDNREARLYLNRLAWRAGAAWVDGAIEALSGTARVFIPPSSCYECTLSEVDRQVLAYRQSCRLLSHDDLLEGKVPTTATTASIIGGLQSQEVVKLIHRDRQNVRPLEGGLILDGANNDLYPLTYPIDDDCLAHHTYSEPIEVESSASLTFRELVEQTGPDGAVVELGDDYLLSWSCTACDTQVPASGPIALATIDDSRCAACGEPRVPNATSSLEVPGPFADATLESFGCRPDDMYAIRRGIDYEYVWATDASALTEVVA